MAHIVASSDAGPRGDTSFPASDRNKYENLILLCPNHHEEVDSEVAQFTSEVLAQMKAEHEAWVERQLTQGSLWREELSTVDYVNVSRLLLDPAADGLVRESDHAYLEELTTLRGQGIYIATIAHIMGKVLVGWRAQTLPLEAIDAIGEEAVGARISFEETFRTRNMTGSEKQKPGFEMSGELKKDPYLYVKKGDRTIYLPLDPRWVTTSTAFVTFTSGIAKLAGVGLLRAVSEEKAIISPLAIGSPPLSPGAKAFEEGLFGS